LGLYPLTIMASLLLTWHLVAWNPELLISCNSLWFCACDLAEEKWGTAYPSEYYASLQSLWGLRGNGKK
jgi:hypothetical protein